MLLEGHDRFNLLYLVPFIKACPDLGRVVLKLLYILAVMVKLKEPPKSTKCPNLHHLKELEVTGILVVNLKSKWSSSSVRKQFFFTGENCCQYSQIWWWRTRANIKRCWNSTVWRNGEMLCYGACQRKCSFKYCVLYLFEMPVFFWFLVFMLCSSISIL